MVERTQPDESLLVPLGEHVALFLLGSDEEMGVPGRVIADVEPQLIGALAKTAATLEGVGIPGTLTGRLVELDSQTVSALHQAKMSPEAGGWMRGTLPGRDGKIFRVARFRPASAVGAVANVAGVVSAVSQQAQLAAIRDELGSISSRLDYLTDWEHAKFFGSAKANIEQANQLARAVVVDGPGPTLQSKAQIVGHELGQVTETCEHLLAQQVQAFTQASGQRTPGAVDRQLKDNRTEISSDLLLLDAAAQAAHARCDAIILAEMIRTGEHTAGYEQQVNTHLRAWLESRQTIVEQLGDAAKTVERNLPKRWRAWARPSPDLGGLFAVRRRDQAAATLAARRGSLRAAVQRTRTIRDDLALLLELGEPDHSAPQPVCAPSPAASAAEVTR